MNLRNPPVEAEIGQQLQDAQRFGLEPGAQQAPGPGIQVGSAASLWGTCFFLFFLFFFRVVCLIKATTCFLHLCFSPGGLPDKSRNTGTNSKQATPMLSNSQLRSGEAWRVTVFVATPPEMPGLGWGCVSRNVGERKQKLRAQTGTEGLMSTNAVCLLSLAKDVSVMCVSVCVCVSLCACVLVYLSVCLPAACLSDCVSVSLCVLRGSDSLSLAACV